MGNRRGRRGKGKECKDEGKEEGERTKLGEEKYLVVRAFYDGMLDS